MAELAALSQVIRSHTTQWNKQFLDLAEQVFHVWPAAAVCAGSWPWMWTIGPKRSADPVTQAFAS